MIECLIWLMDENKQTNILLIEDPGPADTDSRIILADCGYNVVIAADGGEALEKIGDNAVDIVLIDIDTVPGPGNGTDSAAAILERHEIPLIFLISRSDTGIAERTEGILSYGYIEKGTTAAVFDASIKAALRLFRNLKASGCLDMENELFETRMMLDDVLNTIPIRVFWKNLDSVYLGCNRKFAQDSNRKNPDEIIGLTDYDIRTDEIARMNREDDLSIIESGRARVNYEEPFITSDGDKNWIVTSKIPLRNSDGRLYGILGMYENITARKRMEEELLLQKNRLENILHGSNVGTWEWNVQTGENIINENWAAIIGYSLDEVISGPENFWRELIHPDDLARADEVLLKHFRGELEYYECEFRMRHKEGRWIWVLSRGKVISRTDNNEPLIVSGTHLNIDEDKRRQEDILRQLSEKETILREAHHRIKNNISSIGSLLSMHAEAVDDNKAREALTDAMGRVRSMEVLYRKLTFAEDLRNTPLKSYVSELIDDIVNVFPDMKNIKVEKNIHDCSLKPNQLFPLGIIVNELLTNVMKYAFIGRTSGLIRISLEETNGWIRLVIHDNGNGLPDNFDPGNRKGFGLMLIQILCKQLGGIFVIENAGGAMSTLKFRISGN